LLVRPQPWFGLSLSGDSEIQKPLCDALKSAFFLSENCSSAMLTEREHLFCSCLTAGESFVGFNGVFKRNKLKRGSFQNVGLKAGT
jgi:hypothetical protein